MHYRLLPVFSLLLSVFICCSDNVSPIENEELDLIPLKLDNEWEYEQTTSDSTGKIDYIDYNIESVLKDTVISNIRWYQFNTSNYIWYTNKEDGYWSYIIANKSHSTDSDTTQLVFKKDYYRGENFHAFDVIAVDTMIIVPAGKFNCIHLSYKFDDPDNYLLFSYEVFLSAGIGRVKWMQIGEISNNQKFTPYKGELTRYILN